MLNRNQLQAHWIRSTFVLSLFTLPLLSCAKGPYSGPSPQKDSNVGKTVIYGTDDRHDLFDETDPHVRQVADSTVALIKNANLTKAGNGTIAIHTSNFGQGYYLCEGERFREQDTAAFCSGFLIGPDLIATAGHCATSLLNCQETSFVFGFAYQAPLLPPKSVPESEVYNCRELIHSQMESSGADFAIIRLDRPVQKHAPLNVRRSSTIAPGDEVTVLGHPSGLPLKIAGGAKVRSVNPAGFFVANLDTYGGNSGSAVINDRTHEVEGILVRGDQDFILKDENKPPCYVSNVCKNDECRGEDVTLISEVLKHF